jgi:hypothetical protein
MTTSDSPLAIDSTPRPDQLLPFASEMGLQRFVERYAKDVLGLNVLASTRRGGRRLFNVDILGVTDAGQPVIIECKWDEVNEKTFTQLIAYGDAFDSARFEERTRMSGLRARQTAPLLVAIGYRFETLHSSILCLAYAYHGIDVTPSLILERHPGAASLSLAVAGVQRAHPKVNKKFSIEERVRGVANQVQHAFWRIDRELAGTPGMVARYSGKDYVNYHAGGGVVAKAKITDGEVRYAVSGSAKPFLLTHARDASRVLCGSSAAAQEVESRVINAIRAERHPAVALDQLICRLTGSTSSLASRKGRSTTRGKSGTLFHSNRVRRLEGRQCSRSNTSSMDRSKSRLMTFAPANALNTSGL